jgi:hypothetical protein
MPCRILHSLPPFLSLPSPHYLPHYPNTPMNTTLLLFFFTHSTLPCGNFLSKFRRARLRVFTYPTLPYPALPYNTLPYPTLPYPPLIPLSHPSLPYRLINDIFSHNPQYNTTCRYTAFNLPTLADTFMTISLPSVTPLRLPPHLSSLISRFSPCCVVRRAQRSGKV